MLHTAIYTRTSEELEHDLRRKIEARGDVVVGVFSDHAPGRRRYAGWRSLICSLDQIDQIALNDVGDLPGRAVKDLLAILTTVTAHGVSITVPPLHIHTKDGVAAVIALTEAYRRAKKSAAIKHGQDRAKKAGRRIGRPPIPMSVRRRILAELRAGGSVRGTARKMGTSPAAVIDIRRTMAPDANRLAA